MVGKLAAIMGCAALMSAALLGCGAFGGSQAGPEPSPSGGVAGARSGSPTGSDASTPDAQGPLANSVWVKVSEGPDSFKGSPVDITGEVFNVLEDSDGYHRFQIYTEPSAGKGNTHVAIRDLPRQMKKGYQVRVVGTLLGTRVSKSVSGKELRIPEVEAQSVEVLGPPAVVTPTATTQPSATPTATKEPTAEPTARPATSTPTALPATATPKATARPSPPTAAPTSAATATGAASTPVPATPTAPAATAEATSAPAIEATSVPTVVGTPEASEPTEGQAGQPVVVQAASAQLTAPMAVGEDPNASGGRYLYTSASDQGWNGKGPPPATGLATLSLEVPADGTYALWAHLWYAGIDGNSLWISVDDGPAVKVGNDEGSYRRWRWVGWHDGSPANRISMKLSAGTHTVRLIGREAGTRVDSLLVTDDLNHVPQ